MDDALGVGCSHVETSYVSRGTRPAVRTINRPSSVFRRFRPYLKK